MKFGRGTLLVANLGPTVGHEQRGSRPCILVSDPEVSADQRFPLLCIIPITGTSAVGSLYPRLAPGPSGLTKPSFALIDHLRSIDKRRVRRMLGKISALELESIDHGLRLFLGFEISFATQNPS